MTHGGDVIDYVHETMRKIFRAVGKPPLPRSHFAEQDPAVLKRTYETLKGLEADCP